MEHCIIIDDEPKARILLEAVVKQYCPQLQIVALCEDLPTGVKAIKKHKPSLVFLDIEMPGHSGLELLDFFNEDEINFSVIFTTAYNEYAVQAFRFSAIDYLLKPIQHTQLVEAVERFLKKQNQQKSVQLKNLKENLSTATNWEDKRIAVPSAQTIHFFKPSEIILIKGEAAYSEIHLSNGSKLLASRNLKHFEDMLKDIPIFFRSHKSYIINRQEVKEYVKSDGGYLVLSNGIQAGLSSEKVDEFLEKFQ
jgi:two-component system, LytTR family, response regulator